MPRIRTVTLDSLSFKIAPLSYDEAEQYIKDGREMLDRDPKPTDEEWARRTLESVVNTLNKASANGNGSGHAWDVKRLTSELDMVTIQWLYREFMEMSGLRKPDMGEVPATSTGN